MTRAKRETVLYGMAGERQTDLITAAAAPEGGNSAALMIEETFAEQEYSCLAVENNIEGKRSFGLRSTVGLNVRDIECPSMTVVYGKIRSIARYG